MALEPGIASLVYIITIIGFILTLVLLAFSTSVLLQASLRKLPPRILLHINKNPSPNNNITGNNSDNTGGNENLQSGFNGGYFVSPYDGILH